MNCEGLAISQLKTCYKMLIDPSKSFYIEKDTINKIDDIGVDSPYYLLHHSLDNSNRALFDPVTIDPHSSPDTKDLDLFLTYLKSNEHLKEKKISRIVLPIGEMSRHLLLPSFHHMITLIIDIKNMRIGETYPSIRATIIDPFSRSIPTYHRTSEILEILKRYYNVLSFQREYIGHQAWLDRHSCCYFALKVIKKALSETIQPKSSFTDNIPMGDTWFSTSYNWLTIKDKQSIFDSVVEYFQKYEKDVERETSKIIEV